MPLDNVYEEPDDKEGDGDAIYDEDGNIKTLSLGTRTVTRRERKA